MCVCVCFMKGVSLCERDQCRVCINSSQYHETSRHLRRQPQRHKTKARGSRPALHAEEQPSSKITTATNKQQQPIHMQHKETEQEDDLERLHIHADPSSLR